MMKDEEIYEIGQIVVDQAQSIFEYAEAMEDFCVQHISLTLVIFGGVNRLLWSVKYGWVLDKSYCSPKFISRFETYKKQYLIK